MERERREPTFGKPDLRDMQFRGERNRNAGHNAAPASSSLVWKIALGVFLGLSACGLATCTVLGSLGYAVQQEQEAQMHKAIDDLQKIANDPDPMGFRQLAAQKQREEAERAAEYERRNAPAPLLPDERCIGSTRLRRIENGWVQAGSCP